MQQFVFDNTWTTLIRKHIPLSEKTGELAPEILHLIKEQEWFKLYLPRAADNTFRSFLEILFLLENIAKADGSVGWVVTLCSGASWFVGFLDMELAQEIFNQADACIAGSGAATGTAIKTKNGYRINGNWKYATGAKNATHFTVNCIVQNSENTYHQNQEKHHLIKSFVLKKEEVNTFDNWEYIGMKSSNSQGFMIENIEVDTCRSFAINGQMTLENTLFRYPFLELAQTTLAVNFSGMAIHFLEEIEQHFYQEKNIEFYDEKEKIFFEKKYFEHRKQLEKCRSEFYELVEKSWNALINQEIIEKNLLEEIGKKSKKLAHLSRQIVDDLFPFLGMKAASTDSEINRIWRDIHTASQHRLMTFEE